MSPAAYIFDANETGGTRFLDECGDTVSWIRVDVFPPVGTTILLQNGSSPMVVGSTLDLSNPSGIAQILVKVRYSASRR